MAQLGWKRAGLAFGTLQQLRQPLPTIRVTYNLNSLKQLSCTHTHRRRFSPVCRPVTVRSSSFLPPVIRRIRQEWVVKVRYVHLRMRWQKNLFESVSLVFTLSAS